MRELIFLAAMVLTVPVSLFVLRYIATSGGVGVLRCKAAGILYFIGVLIFGAIAFTKYLGISLWLGLLPFLGFLASAIIWRRQDLSHTLIPVYQIEANYRTANPVLRGVLFFLIVSSLILAVFVLVNRHTLDSFFSDTRIPRIFALIAGLAFFYGFSVMLARKKQRSRDVKRDE